MKDEEDPNIYSTGLADDPSPMERGQVVSVGPTGPGLACRLCERPFGSPEHLREHEYGHALSLMAAVSSLDWPHMQGSPRGPPGPQPASSQPLLLRHDRPTPSVATATARYFCTRCPASFTLKSNADRHEKTVHFKRKPMQCVYCLKPFRDRTDLQRHLSSVHSQERGHTCPACTKAFSTQKNLATHVKVCCQAGMEPGPLQEPGWY
ncbi:hypothetical protein NHX12_012203 [Muraenolepis orangiensis]|uniref:C2H2-type domain-containing protein n=1 Tax=Muraenolepis orangiensis TaxID=630683 RepID=A0A9Q0DC84_9TELE|nr:hypothetical protein NHX12_012203 [Muraenolepis orangiensis]